MESGQFVIDGPKLVRDAIVAGLSGLVLYAEPEADPEILALAAERSVEVVPVVAGALEKTTSPVAPQALAAVASIPSGPDLSALSGLLIVLADVSDPGNVGTLIRASEAAGAAAVVCSGDGADVWNPKVVRSAAGSSFRLPIAEGGDTLDCLERLRASGMTIVATTPTGGASLDHTDLTGDIAVLLGSEAHGLDDQVVARCDRSVSIPMVGAVESLNVAMAGTIVAFESARQRRTRERGTSSST